MPVRSAGDLALEVYAMALRNLAPVATKLVGYGPWPNAGQAAHQPAAAGAERETVTADLRR